MDITFRSQGFETDHSVAGFLQYRLKSALSRFDEQVVSVDVFMKDVNGPKGGVDKQVIMRTRLRNSPLIATQVKAASLYAAIADCTRKTKRCVTRSVNKLKRVDRKQRIRRLDA
ncbi:MAG: HPF/RaiA family ribosome-associated protein [Pseudomonadota bacterium]